MKNYYILALVAISLTALSAQRGQRFPLSRRERRQRKAAPVDPRYQRRFIPQVMGGHDENPKPESEIVKKPKPALTFTEEVRRDVIARARARAGKKSPTPTGI